MIKLTKYEQVRRSIIKKKMRAEDPTWTRADIKLHFAQLPELWVPKKGRTEIEYQRRLTELKDQWCPKEIIYWNKVINNSLLLIKKKG